MFGGLSVELLAAAFAIAALAGVVKGTVGFAMPMVMISGLSLFLPAEVALAGLIGATLVGNATQALRQGLSEARAAIWRFRVFIVLVVIFIAVSAQLVPYVSSRVLYGLIGVPVTLFGLTQLLGWRLRYAPQHQRRVECILGPIAGCIGGISGIWGPPTVAFLLPLNLPKAEFVRVQGVVYLLGAVMLVGAHITSGVLNRETVPLSVLLILPAMVGMRVGFWLQDKLDRQRFLQVTLVVLIVAGLNLLRRAVLG